MAVNNSSPPRSSSGFLDSRTSFNLAVAGGGVFGDHCSPLSDTTILSSLGSACDHMDHVRTQIPYALVVAGVTIVFYFLIGSIS